MFAAASALSFVACSAEVAESSFDSPLPWHASEASYEKLDYTVAVYNTEKGVTDDKRVIVGDGTLSFTLEEGAQNGYTALSMEFSVTYRNEDAAGEDKGLTDTIRSTVYFEPNSLTASSVNKEVVLATRKGKTNLSYTITADYFETHKATFKYTAQDGAKEKTRTLPRDAVRDNEMMFFLARAQEIGKGSSTTFQMVNLYDTFNSGELAEYRMVVNGTAESKMDIGDFVKDFGIEAVTDEESGKTSYPVTCITTSLSINAEKHGPSYTVLYAKDAFLQGEAKHNKIPVKIEYSSYNGLDPYRMTTYTLRACSITK